MQKFPGDPRLRNDAGILRFGGRSGGAGQNRGGIPRPNSIEGPDGTYYDGRGYYNSFTNSYTPCNANFSQYNNTTGLRSRYPNLQTNLSQQEFGTNLEKSGWTKRTYSDGRIDYVKDGRKYTLRNSQNNGPTADYGSASGGKADLKIRLQP